MVETKEAVITINGVTLSLGQAMTLRVAITEFAEEMAPNTLGGDAHGLSMSRSYSERSLEILELILRPQN